MASRSVMYSRCTDEPPRTYSLMRWATAMASVTSDDVDESPLDPLEVDQAQHQGHDADERRGPDERPERGTAEDRAPKSVDNAGHHIQAEHDPPVLGHDGRRVGHRRRIEPHLHQE